MLLLDVFGGKAPVMGIYVDKLSSTIDTSCEDLFRNMIGRFYDATLNLLARLQDALPRPTRAFSEHMPQMTFSFDFRQVPYDYQKVDCPRGTDTKAQNIPCQQPGRYSPTEYLMR